jgi:hypothetical protein
VPSSVAQCRRQELPVYEELERVAKCILGIDGRIEARFAKLDGAHERYRTCRRAICKCKIRVLIALSDERLEIATRKAVLVDDLRPHVGALANVLRNTDRLICSGVHA